MDNAAAGGDVSLVRSSSKMFPALRRTAPGRSSVGSSISGGSAVSKNKLNRSSPSNGDKSAHEETATGAAGTARSHTAATGGSPKRRSSLARPFEIFNSGGSPNNSSSNDNTPLKSARSRSIFLSATARFTGGGGLSTKASLEPSAAVTAGAGNGGMTVSFVEGDRSHLDSPNAATFPAGAGFDSSAANRANGMSVIVRSSFTMFRRASASSTNSGSTNSTSRSYQNHVNGSSSNRVDASAVPFSSSVNSSLHTQQEETATASGYRGSSFRSRGSSSRRNSALSTASAYESK